MAKIATCGYGSKGEGLGKTPNGYTYLVNDNVRTGDKIQVIATSHGKEPRKFVTTAVPKSIFNENSANGQNAKQQAQQNSKSGEIETGYTGTELGLTPTRESIRTKSLGNGHRTVSQYQMETRGAVVGKYLQTHPDANLTPKARETFDSYSKPFMKGEQ